MRWIISGVAIVVFVLLIKSDIPLSYLFKGKISSIKRIYVKNNFVFSLKYQCFMLTMLSVIIIVLSLLFYLPKDYIVLLLLFTWISYPVFLLWQLQYRYHASDYEQITSFLQHFLAHFKSSNKVLLALYESKEYAKDELKTLVDSAIDVLEESGDAAKAFDVIASKYPHFIVYNIQTWITSAEMYGVDDCKEAVELLEDDIDDWIEDTHLHVMSLHQMKNKILTLCMLSIIIAMFNQTMLKAFMELKTHQVYHNVIFVFLLIILFTMMMVYRFLKESWISKGECLWKKSS